MRGACRLSLRQSGQASAFVALTVKKGSIANCCYVMMLGSKGLLPPLIPDCSALRALTILKNIRNPLIFLRKMASYSCFWRVPRLKIFMQASLHQISNLLTLVSCNYFKDFIFSESSFNCSSEGLYCIFRVSRQISKPHFFSSSSICPLACPPQP